MKVTVEQLNEIATKIATDYPKIMDLIDESGLPAAVECYIRDAVAEGTDEELVIVALLDDAGDVSTQMTFELLGQIAKNY